MAERTDPLRDQARPGPTATVIVATLGGERLGNLLASLDDGSSHQTLVVDNGSPRGVAEVCEPYDSVEVLRMDTNVGFVGAVNLGAERADGEAIVLVNDDCVCDPGFVDALVRPLDPGGGVVMSAGVMRDWRHRELIDSAGMELDRTLLVFDYLNGEPVSRLENVVADPIGPSGAAAAFDRATFTSVGGFDRRLFAYGEDVDLVLRLRRLGFSCRLAPDARGYHEHSASFGSGSPRKNYLTGFARGYLLRKWGVLTPGRAGPVLIREAAICAGQALIDRNLTGVRGRAEGYRRATEVERYPSAIEFSPSAGGAVATLRRRLRRRIRLRTAKPPAPGSSRSLAVFHLAETSGPSRSLEAEMDWLAERGGLDVVIPGRGALDRALGGAADVFALDYEALTLPRPGPRGLVDEARRLRREVRMFRGLIRQRRPTLVLQVTTMLPAVMIAAWLEGVPALVYCGELFDSRHRAGLARKLAARVLASLTVRLADQVIACSETVAGQFHTSRAKVVTVYPPVSDRYRAGDRQALRSAYAIPPQAPVIASVGNLTEGRGQDLLVRAMPAILRAAPEARYLIVGAPFPRSQDLAFRERLVALIDQLELGDSVTVAGHIENISDVYAAADVVVNPARFNEPFGRVPFEAAIAGTPAVVTRVGAIPELLIDGESALIVAPEDPGALGEAIVRLLGDERLARTLVAGAADVVASRLTPADSLAGFRHSVAMAAGDEAPAPR